MRMASETELKHDFWERMEDSPILMVGLTGVPEHSEPLTAQLDKDQVDTLYFFIARDNRLAKGGPAMAQLVSKGHDFFACLRGTARVDNDPAMIDKLWYNQVEAWFAGWRNAPKLALLRLDIDSPEMWAPAFSLGVRRKR